MKKVFLLSLVMLSGIFAYAQSETIVNVESKRGPYITNRFFDNWFISAGGGAQIYFGEYDSEGAFKNRIAPALDVSLGKWITPTVGVRLQYSGLKAKGFANTRTPYYNGMDGRTLTKEKFNVMNLHADFLWNISNAISGYREDRFWDVIPYVGFGWARSSANDYYKNEMAGTVGLLNNMRISRSLDINVEAKFMMVNQRFDQTVGGKKLEGMATLTAGITYNFPMRGFRRASEIIVVDDNTPYINTISDLRSQLAKANAARKALADELAAEKSKGPKVVEKTNAVVSDYAVFFTIGKADVSAKEMINLSYIADVIKRNPKAKFTLFASADKETGTAEYNQQLSEKRGKAVYDILTKEYGVNPEQLKVEAVGSSNQRFKGAQFNRVVIIEDGK